MMSSKGCLNFRLEWLNRNHSDEPDSNRFSQPRTQGHQRRTFRQSPSDCLASGKIASQRSHASLADHQFWPQRGCIGAGTSTSRLPCKRLPDSGQPLIPHPF